MPTATAATSSCSTRRSWLAVAAPACAKVSRSAYVWSGSTSVAVRRSSRSGVLPDKSRATQLRGVRGHHEAPGDPARDVCGLGVALVESGQHDVELAVVPAVPAPDLFGVVCLEDRH